MTKNVERTKCVKGVINVEVTNDNIKKITLLLNNNWTVAHMSGDRNEAIQLYIVIFKMKQLWIKSTAKFMLY